MEGISGRRRRRSPGSPEDTSFLITITGSPARGRLRGTSDTKKAFILVFNWFIRLRFLPHGILGSVASRVAFLGAGVVAQSLSLNRGIVKK